MRAPMSQQNCFGRGARLGALAAALLAAVGAACSNSSPATAPTPVDASVSRSEAGNPLCVDGKSAGYPAAKARPELMETSPDLTFQGADGPIALHDYFEPCAARSRLLVVRVGAAWCGTCLWHLKHTSDTKKSSVGDRLQWLDLQLANRDNEPATVADLPAYRALIDAPEAVAIDPAFQLHSVDPVRGALPFIVLIDTRTMTVRNYLHDPDPQALELRIGQELAILDGQKPPPYPVERRFDELFFQNQWDLLHDMTLPGAPPPDPTNAVADDPAAAALGKALFSDTRLSPSGRVSCASCHDPAKSFQDGVPQSTAGIATVDRNSPPIALAAHARWQFWDGRADTLWMQALGPFENEKEIAASRLFVVHAALRDHAAAFGAVFGSVPDLSDAARFPAVGKPGDPAWQGMQPADRKTVDGVFVNLGKAIAAYERTLRVKPTKFDAYVAGDLTALDPAQKLGLHAFFVNGCVQCHWGPRFTNDAFHPDGYPTGRQDGLADRGRIDGVAQLLASDFAQPHPGLVVRPRDLGSFKTPTLRGVAASAPYGHGGTLATLQDVVRVYGTAGLPASDPRTTGVTEPWLPQFARSHADDMLPFLDVLTGGVTE